MVPVRVVKQKKWMPKIGLPKKYLFLISRCCQKLSVPYNTWEWMAATDPWKKSPYMKEWMAQTDPAKEDITVKKMNNRSLLLSSNKMIYYYKEWTVDNCKWCFWKKIYCLYKNLMLQIDPLNSNCSQNLQYPKRKLRLN